MAAWKYIKGNSSHFSGAPDWAIYYVEVKRENGRTTRAWEGDDYRYCYTPTSEGFEEPMKEFTGLKGVISYKWLEAEVEIVAQRERVTSINDDRLAQDMGLNPKYNRPCKGVTIDVYDVLQAFNVTNPALQHLVKKALAVGQRGHKDKMEDLRDVLASAQRAIELEEGEGK